MDKEEYLRTTRVHEYYRCKSSFELFAGLAMLLNTDPRIKLRLDCFNAYTDFLSHLYEYYASFIKDSKQFNRESIYSNEPKIPDYQMYEKMLNEEVNKLCRNNKAVIERGESVLGGYTADYFDCVAPADFGRHFRLIRNRKSHTDYRRASEDEITLSDFYKLYHKYILILYYQAGFLWTVDVETYNWYGIQEFANELNSHINSKIYKG